MEKGKEKIVTTKSDVGLDLKTIYDKNVQTIKEKVNGIAVNYILIGYYLNELVKEDLYKTGGYTSISELAKTEFDLSHTAINNSMGVAKKYCDENGQLKDEFMNYKFSALVELLPVENEKVEIEYNPEMTVKEIRDKKKSDKLVKPKAKEKQIEMFEDDDAEDETNNHSNQTITYLPFEITDLRNTNPLIVNLLSLIIKDSYSTLFYNLISKDHLKFYISDEVDESNPVFLEIKVIDSELNIRCSNDAFNNKLQELIKGYFSFISLLSTLFDVQEIHGEQDE